MKQPNILFILSDDQGAWAMHCAGNTDLHTPNLDRIAARGTRFENFFCVSPVCSPARASILTGTIPSVHGVHDWLRGGNLDQEKALNAPDETVPIQYTSHLTGYTDLLAQSGYTCALSGKWHLGDSVTPQHGYSRWFTIGRGGCNYYEPDLVRDGKVFYDPEGRYITDIITEDALRNIRELSAEQKPFYLGVHYTAPHSPWDEKNHPAEFIDMYRDCAFTATPDLPIHPWQVPSAPCGTGEKRKELLRGYYAAITAMDRNIGKLLDELEAQGIADNTILIFTADNGMNMGHHGIWGKGNGTFPQNMFDTSVKVPFLISWPGHFPQGKVESAMASHYDILPTLRELLNLQGEVRQPLPGKSILPLLEGKEGGSGEIVVFDEYGPVRMIRTAEWKYIQRTPYGPNELYHLTDDPEETKNWFGAPEYAAIEQELRARLNHWFVQYTDPNFDGSREPVTGFGQLCRAGTMAEGKNTYAEAAMYWRKD